MKDLIVVRGRKLYPQDLEFTAESSHAAIRANGCAAFAIPSPDGDRIVIAVEVELRYLRSRTSRGVASAPDEDIPAAVRQCISETHEVALSEVLVLAPGSLPRTTSGKLRRSACRELWNAGGFSTAGAAREVVPLPIPA
jgi:acyl-CoA synthetase (AMP-forming)/AMP-acid ligase II